MRGPTWKLLLALVVVLGGPADTGATTEPRIAVLPIQDNAGDRIVVERTRLAVRDVLARRGLVLDMGQVRDVLRANRIRDADATYPARLRELASQLSADWLVAVTVHDAERRVVPRLALSARAYAADDGELFWTAFQGGSGLDGETVFGLGRIDAIELLIPGVVESLLGELVDPGRRDPVDAGTGRRDTQATRVAVVPLDSLTAERRTANARTVTEATRAALFRSGLRVVAPGCTADVVNRQQAGMWGGVADRTRVALRQECAADRIVVGSVEVYDEGFSRGEPDPKVAVSLRALDAESGRILWTGAAEGLGSDSDGLFRLGRVHSRGALVERMLVKLTRNLVKKRGSDFRRSEDVR